MLELLGEDGDVVGELKIFSDLKKLFTALMMTETSTHYLLNPYIPITKEPPFFR